MSTIGEWFCTATQMCRLLRKSTPVLVCALFAADVRAAPPTGEDEPRPQSMEVISVIGTRSDALRMPGSAEVLDERALERFGRTDIHLILSQVPGVSVREEEGYGLRPNIGMRGSGSARSARITLMEDGVNIAPAPYSAPSAYYFPTIARMSAVEVFKGPASIQNGPQTVGGVINLRSSALGETGGLLQAELGSHAERRLHARYAAGAERVSALVERHEWSSAGFRKIAQAGGDTGLDKVDSLVKLRLRSSEAAHLRQDVLLKLTRADETSRQSYLGLTEADARRRPQLRYAASALDRFDGESQTRSLRYTAGTDVHRISAVYYRNEFERNWYKSEGLDPDGSAGGNGANARRRSWGAIIAEVDAGGADADDYRRVLEGGSTTGDERIVMRDNAREYLSKGFDIRYRGDFEGERTSHRLDMGWRDHSDWEDRLQRYSDYRLDGGRLALDEIHGWGEWGVGNRLLRAQARALFIHYELDWNDWRISPGLRRESVRQSRRDWSDAARTRLASGGVRRNRFSTTLPGLSVVRRISDRLNLFAGVHKGFTPAGYSNDAAPEESLNWEWGARFRGGGGASAGALVFFNDYRNLLGMCTAESGADCEVGDAFSGRGAAVLGLELELRCALGSAAELNLSYTWSDAEFSETFDSDFFGAVRSGDAIPYVSRHHLSAALGWTLRPGWRLDAQAVYRGATCTMALCGARQRIDAQTTFGIGVQYTAGENLRAYLRGHRLGSDGAIVARQPYGAMTMAPERWVLGLAWSF
ncbi:MAG: TonB-dependent receptor plug domain-containing protein [Gammaproteobacteria bacterium AqS3]|nr:TonB-dependent receptor plug domain-containing protein [Gammaproteobacteria bacterium AqS3]